MSYSAQMMIAKLMVVMVACMLPTPVVSSDSCDWWCQGYNAPWGGQVRLEFWSLHGLRRVRAASHRKVRRLVQRACERMVRQMHVELAGMRQVRPVLPARVPDLGRADAARHDRGAKHDQGRHDYYRGRLHYYYRGRQYLPQQLHSYK